MNKFLCIVFIFTLGFFYCNAQNQKLSNFIPEGYVIYEKYFGDINKDGQVDCVLVIKNSDKNAIVVNRFGNKVDRNRRGIIVLLKKGNNYQLTDKNYNCFSSENEDGGLYYPPQLGIELLDGNLIIHYNHGRYGYWKYVFRFTDSDLKLIAYDSSNHRGPIINRETNINFLTKKKLIKENINENAEGGGDEVFKETKFDIKINNLIKLSDIKNFDELELYNY